MLYPSHDKNPPIMSVIGSINQNVSLETLPNVNMRYPSHDKNPSIMSVIGSINQNVFILTFLFVKVGSDIQQHDGDYFVFIKTF